MNLPTNEIIEFPTGKWGFVGRVSVSLSFGRKDGTPLTDDDEAEIARLHSFGERFVVSERTPYKLLVWDTKADAESAKAMVAALDAV